METPLVEFKNSELENTTNLIDRRWLQHFYLNNINGDGGSIIIDLQGFQLRQTFVVKEMAIYDGYRLAHYIFKPNIPFKNLSPKERCQVRWLEQNHHCLSYSDGYVCLSELPVILHRFTKNYQRVYVKGHQKQKILRMYFNGPIVNLEMHFAAVPSLRNRTSENCCMAHKKCPSVCAISNVKILYDFLTPQKDRIIP